MKGCKPRIVAAASVNNAGGAVTFVDQTNSGAFSGITDNGVGDVTLALNEGCDTAKHIYQVTPRQAGFAAASVVAADATIQVLTFDAAGAAADASFDLVVVRSRG